MKGCVEFESCLTTEYVVVVCVMFLVSLAYVYNILPLAGNVNPLNNIYPKKMRPPERGRYHRNSEGGEIIISHNLDHPASLNIPTAIAI